MKCTSCGKKAPRGCDFCPFCGESLPSHPRKKRKKAIWIGIAAVVLILLTVLTLAFVYLKNSPLVKIAGAFANTLDADNFSFTLSGDGTGFDLIGRVVTDGEARGLALDLALRRNGRENLRLVVYRCVAVYGYRDHWMGSLDIQKPLDALFCLCQAMEDPQRLEELLEKFGLWDLAQAHLDLKEAEKALSSWLRRLSSRSWLEDYAGYTERRQDGQTICRFEGTPRDFLLVSLESFEQAFLSREEYEALRQWLAESLPASRCVLTLTIEDDLIRSLQLEVTGEVFQLRLWDVGSTQLDEEALADILEQAQ